jgi:hypothetical protein
LVDRAPPSRYSVVERGGRLVVVDRETGRTPPSAAERMAEHDRRRGHAAERPVLPDRVSETLVEPARPPRTVAAPAASVRAARRGADAAKRERQAAMQGESKRAPWGGQKQRARPQTPATRAPAPAEAPAPARAAPRSAASLPARKTVVTGKWWDAKGPRTLELGPKGQAQLSGGLMVLFFGVVIAAVVALLVEPLLLFIGAFLLFRFGSQILGTIGAGIVDKALAEKG